MNRVHEGLRAAGSAFFSVVTGLAMLICVGAQGADAQVPLALYDAEQDRLSVAAEGRSFADVLAAVASAAGFKVALNRSVEGESPMTLAFQDLPLEQGLARVLEGKSFALERSGPGNRVSKVWVLSELAPAQVLTVPAPSVPPSASVPTLPADARVQIPQLTSEQLQHITDSLREYQTRTGTDPREQLEALRRLMSPDSPSFENIPDDELADELLKMIKGKGTP